MLSLAVAPAGRSSRRHPFPGRRPHSRSRETERRSSLGSTASRVTRRPGRICTRRHGFARTRAHRRARWYDESRAYAGRLDGDRRNAHRLAAVSTTSLLAGNVRALDVVRDSDAPRTNQLALSADGRYAFATNSATATLGVARITGGTQPSLAYVAHVALDPSPDGLALRRTGRCCTSQARVARSDAGAVPGAKRSAARQIFVRDQSRMERRIERSRRTRGRQRSRARRRRAHCSRLRSRARGSFAGRPSRW